MNNRSLYYAKGVLCVISFSFLCTGCKHGQTTDVPPENAAMLTLLNGQISGWSLGGHRFIDMVYYTGTGESPGNHYCGRAAIDAQGKFAFTTLSNVDVFTGSLPVYPLLHPAPNTIIVKNTLVCSDTSAQFVTGSLLMGSDSTTKVLGEIFRASAEVDAANRPGEYFSSFVYSTKDVRLTGTIQFREHQSSDSTILTEFIEHYDLTFVKGWNRRVQYYVANGSYKETGNTIIWQEYSFTNDEPKAGKWVFIAYQ